jgi:aromatase
MRTLNTIEIDASPDKVFDLAARVENWPKILPHYRWVRLLAEQGESRSVEMAALRTIIPVKWTSVQTVDKENRRIYYEHTGGATRGMWVEWTLIPLAGGRTQATIMHDLTLRGPIVRTWIGKLITGRVFVTHIADETLKHIKRAAETGGGEDRS